MEANNKPAQLGNDREYTQVNGSLSHTHTIRTGETERVEHKLYLKTTILYHTI